MNCYICARGCTIPEGKTGACGQYYVRSGILLEHNPNKYIVICPISIETMPMLHFYPGGKFLQISTVGCNFNCSGCISTVIVKEMAPHSSALQELIPEQVVQEAQRQGCIGITFLMNDPLASFFTFLEVAKTAKEHGLLVGCSSNTYFTEKSLNEIMPYLDFINVGLKGFYDHSYRNCGVSSTKPIWRNIEALHAHGVHVEVSCIHTKENKQELFNIAQLLASIDKNIPLQIMRFIPVENTDVALEPTIIESELLCQELTLWLNQVYLFNSPGTGFLNTYCPHCLKLVIKREFYGPMGSKLRASGLVRGSWHCTECDTDLNIVGELTDTVFQEVAFQGGYPFTRALEMMEAILIAIGVDDSKEVVAVWEHMLSSNGLVDLHHALQNPTGYLQLIKDFGRLVQRENQAQQLINYIETKMSLIEQGFSAISRKPRVYYAMGKPNFCINANRLENQLVETAGGISVNKQIKGQGRPGVEIAYEQLQQLNPEIIMISSFMPSPAEDIYEQCLTFGLRIEAVKNKRIYNYPAPCWDFGSPRWILGLMYLANIFHPDVYNFNIMEEATNFYRQFYRQDFNVADINRSFGKPSNRWQWKAV